MATIDQIYRDNLRVLIKEAECSQDAFAELIGKSPAQVSQWLNASKDKKTGKPRAMSRQIARYIEARRNKPEGWMDQPHAGDSDPGKPVKGAFLEAVTPEAARCVRQELEAAYAHELAASTNPTAMSSFEQAMAPFLEALAAAPAD